jgi:hypothetical protein
MIGWYHTTHNTNWGCYQAQKVGVAAWSPPQFNHKGKQTLEADAVIAPVGLLETQASLTMFVPDMEFIDTVNRDGASTWTAGVPTSFLGLSEEEVQILHGRDRFAGKSALRRKAAKMVHGGTLRHRTRGTGSIHYTSKDRLLEQQYKLPQSIDLRQHTQVRSQGHCGSCYAFATAGALEGRISFATDGRSRPTISPQSMLSCSVTNQGCQGGYPILLAKHLSEVGAVPESCFPYDIKVGMVLLWCLCSFPM